jgi:hypothetical protein
MSEVKQWAFAMGKGREDREESIEVAKKSEGMVNRLVRLLGCFAEMGINCWAFSRNFQKKIGG